MQIAFADMGRTKYADAWEFQRQIFDLRHYGLVGDTLLVTEHDPVYTIGKGGDENHLLASEEELKNGGISLFRIDRGGDITYHGPGQLVGYPIIDLQDYKADLHWYLRSLEEVLILALEEFDIDGVREEGMTGVWVKGEKIAAIGVKISRWITMHGFALNVNTDLSKFDRIIPCGIFHKGVTSMQRILERDIPMEEVRSVVRRAFASVFARNIVPMPWEELHRLVVGHVIERV